MSVRAKCPHCGGDHRIPELDVGEGTPAGVGDEPALPAPDDAVVTCPDCGGRYRISVAVFGRVAAVDGSGDRLRAEQWRRTGEGPISVRDLPPSPFIGHLAPLVVAGAIVHAVFTLATSAVSRANEVEIGGVSMGGPLWWGAAAGLVGLLVVCLFPFR